MKTFLESKQQQKIFKIYPSTLLQWECHPLHNLKSKNEIFFW